MGLNNRQFDEIMSVYDSRRLNNIRLSDKRKDELREKVKGYSDIEDKIFSLRRKKLDLSLNEKDPSGDISLVEDQIQRLYNEKEALVVSAGFPAGYDKVVYDCPFCKDTGFLESEGKRCFCFIKEKTKLLFKQSGLSGLLAAQNYDTLDMSLIDEEDRGSYSNAVEISKNFASSFDDKYDNLLFYGGIGTGKTFLSCCIAGDIMEKGKSVLYLSADKLFKSLIDLRFAEDKDEYMSLTESISDCDLLIIDDLGTEVSGERSEADFFTMLNDRSLARKPVIISTNLNLDEIRSRYSERVFSRISNNFTICKFSGKDLRLKKKLIEIRK